MPTSTLFIRRNAAPKVALGDVNVELLKPTVCPRRERMDEPYDTGDARDFEPRPIQAKEEDAKIEITCRPAAADSLRKLLEDLKYLGGIGASRKVIIDDFPEERGNGEHFFDGDGSDQIHSIKVTKGHEKGHAPDPDRSPRGEDPKNHVDFGCGAFSACVEEHADDPGFDGDAFFKFCTDHNRADRDSGELDGINEDEVHRLFDAFMAKGRKKAFGNGRVQAATFPAYHGTTKRFRAFKTQPYANVPGVFYFSDRPEHAANYALTSEGERTPEGHVKSVQLRLDNPLVVDYHGEKELTGLLEEIEQAKGAGNDGIIAQNIDDGYGVSTHYLVFSPKQISVVAARPKSKWDRDDEPEMDMGGTYPEFSPTGQLLAYHVAGQDNAYDCGPCATRVQHEEPLGFYDRVVPVDPQAWWDDWDKRLLKCWGCGKQFAAEGAPKQAILFPRKANVQWDQILQRFPEGLQEEIKNERPDGDPPSVQELSTWWLRTPQPVEKSLQSLLTKRRNLQAVSRASDEAITAINQKWGLDLKPAGKRFDANPGRYMDYAQKPGATAKPSVMVNGEILWGVGRFIAALIRGDKSLWVWDVENSRRASSFQKKALVHQHTTPPVGTPREDQRSHLDEDLKDELNPKTDDPDLVRHTRSAGRLFR